MHRYRKTDDESYTMGTELTLELVRQHPESTTGVYVSPKQQDNEIYRAVLAACQAHSITIKTDEKIFKTLASKDNCYLLATFKKFKSAINPDTNHVVLVNPGNTGNLGTIMRTAVGFGVPDMAIISPGVDVFDPKVIRASMGAFFNVHWQYFDTIQDYIKTCTPRPLYPFMLTGAVNLTNIEVPYLWSLIFGNEATGLPDEYQQLGQSVLIKHLKTIDSLNLDNAVSIALYAFTRKQFLGKM